MSSSDPQTNDESVSSGSEKMYYVSAECSELHHGRELLNRIYPINIDVLFNLIFTKSEFMVEFLKSRNFQNVEIGDWLDTTSILKNDQQPSSSRNSNARSTQTISPRQSGSSSPRHSSQSSIKRPSKLFLTKISRATQTSTNINTENISDENTKKDLVIIKSSFIIDNEDIAKEDIKNDLVLVRSSVIFNKENNSIEENNKEEIQKKNNIENNKRQSIKEEQNKKNSSSEDDESSNIKKTKTIQYTANSSVGSNVRVTNELVLLKCSIPNELYSINELSSSKGVLYADTFVINVHYCLVRISAEKTKLLVYGDVKFVKNLLLFTKSIIESQVWNGLNDYYKELDIQLQDFSSPRPFSFTSIRRKRSKSRSLRIRTPDSNYETADVGKGSSSIVEITRSFSALTRKIMKFKKTCANGDTSEDCDEILENDNVNNNEEDDYFRKIWNDYLTINSGLGILIAIGFTIMFFLRR